MKRNTKKKKLQDNKDYFKKISSLYISRCEFLADQQRAQLNYQIDKRYIIFTLSSSR